MKIKIISILIILLLSVFSFLPVAVGVFENKCSIANKEIELGELIEPIPVNIPSARRFHSMVCDEAHDKIILFGGATEKGLVDDTWSYDLRDNKWTKMNPSTKPSPRMGHAMTYGRGGKVVLFGGMRTNLSLSDETWVYDYAIDDWIRMNPSTSPSARMYHDMTYDDCGEIILFGGFNIKYNDETWEYDLENDEWTKMNSPPNPSARSGHKMCDIPRLPGILLFGGKDEYGADDETWGFTDDWGRFDVSIKPSTRYYHAMVMNTQHSHWILFGGTDGIIYLDDTWVFTTPFKNWTKMNPSIRPPPRAQHAMAYDEENDKVVLFGGIDSNGDYFSDTWIYDLESDTWQIMKPKSMSIIKLDTHPVMFSLLKPLLGQYI